MDSKLKRNLSNDIYPVYQRQQQTDIIELPSYMVEFTVKLKKDIREVSPNLQDDLRKHYDMGVHVTDSKHITVTGFPPDEAFHQLDALKIVQKRDPGAAVITFKKLQQISCEFISL